MKWLYKLTIIALSTSVILMFDKLTSVSAYNKLLLSTNKELEKTIENYRNDFVHTGKEQVEMVKEHVQEVEHLSTKIVWRDRVKLVCDTVVFEKTVDLTVPADNVNMDSLIQKNGFVKVPILFKKHNSDYKIVGRVLLDGVILDTLNVYPNYVVLIDTLKSNKWNTYTSSITTTNPALLPNFEVSNYKIKIPIWKRLLNTLKI